MMIAESPFFSDNLWGMHSLLLLNKAAIRSLNRIKIFAFFENFKSLDVPYFCINKVKKL